MATATMKLTMQNAILMGVTVVGPVLIWSNALIVGVWLDPLQIIYVSYLIRRAYKGEQDPQIWMPASGTFWVPKG